MTRVRLPETRNSITHKFTIAGHDGYITAGMYPDGNMGELFITIAKEGSTISGLMDALATTVSIALQHGVPLEAITKKMKFTRFEPFGFTGNPDIPSTTSVVDYVARWLELKFVTQYTEHPSMTVVETEKPLVNSASSPPCSICGGLTKRSGACYVCTTCGETTGCG